MNRRVRKLFSSLILMDMEVKSTQGLLYPRDSETREVRSLDGIWNFVKSDPSTPSQGVRDMWFKDDLSKVKAIIPMPVPASYNDITTEYTIRDHVGTVWYDRTFYIPRSWSQQKRVWIRFGSVHYEASVWINGVLVVQHEMGHLPFEVEITGVVKCGERNRVTVLCNNALIHDTVPQGTIKEMETDGGNMVITQSYTFDFFNYAGIQRSVHLYTTPMIYIEDVIVNTDLSADQKVGYVYFQIQANGFKDNNLSKSNSSNNSDDTLYALVRLLDKEGVVVAEHASNESLKGVLEVEDVHPWWPYLMHATAGYLYQLEVLLQTSPQEIDSVVDIYRLHVGIRTIKWDKQSLMINEKPIYLRGFGRHEDSDIRGKGMDYALLTRDFNLIKWIGANTYRTSHYPYSEESMHFADEFGIMVIDECPSADTDIYEQKLLNKHKASIEQLIHRDRNHPSVIMWSIANEPKAGNFKADRYFQFVADFTRKLDSTRPVTAAIATPISSEKAAQHLDIIGFNRYNGWYSNPGRLDMITDNVIHEAIKWNAKHQKPVMMFEYGADTVEGLHFLPSYIWSEEYQCNLFSKHFQAFDVLRKQSWFIGEFVWNFADFKTAQSITRVGGNKKGIFTRNRQPKAVAHLLRKRYFALGRELDQCSLPDDLYTYIADVNPSGRMNSTAKEL